MELKMTPYQLPEKIGFNFEELKAELMKKAEVYEAVIYSDEQIAAAKADRASLNRLKKALNDERIRREREYLQPFNEFKAQVNEIIRIIDKPAQAIDKQVKDFEERKKAEKRQQIEAYWAETGAPGWVAIIDTTWFNASVSMKTIKAKIDAIIAQADKDLAVIRALPAYAFEAEECYKRTHSLAEAVAEAHRLQEMAERKAAYDAEQAKRREEQALKAEQAAMRPTASDADVDARKAAVDVPKPAHTSADEQGLSKTWLSFKALLSVGDAHALREFFDSRRIEFEAL